MSEFEAEVAKAAADITTADTLEVTAGRSDAKFPPSQGLGTGTAEVRDIFAASKSAAAA